MAANTENPDELDEDYKKIDLVGRTFGSREAAFEFYQSYAKENGFDVRRHTSRHDSEGNITHQIFCCCKEGHRKTRIKDCERKRRPKPSTRTGCNARVFVSVMSSGRWNITFAEYDHNHELCEGHLTPFLRGHKTISDADFAEAQASKSVGVRTTHIFKYLPQQKGGLQNVGFLPHDLYNKLGASARKEIVDGDVNAVLAYFQGRKDNDMSFYMNYTTDDELRLHNLFWADGTSRSDYTCFGDVIAFDTTYKKNAYGRPLMPIVGVNHHRQTVVSAIAVLANETSESFEWVIQTFLEAMHQKPPVSVVTDGDRAMERAIKRMLPCARHRLCSWHLSRNALQNTGDRNFAREFTRCMKSPWTTHQFQQQWDFMVQHFKFKDNL